MTARVPSTAVAALLTVALGGCAGSIASYPSLAPRALEQAGATEAASATSAIALDPAVAARATALVVDARRGAASFDAAASAGCGAIARGTGAAEGSEAWVAAQQALSTIEAERTATEAARDDLDQLILDQARLAQDSVSPVDLAPLTDAAREIAVFDAAQNTRLADLRAKGCQP